MNPLTECDVLIFSRGVRIGMYMQYIRSYLRSYVIARLGGESLSSGY